MWGRPKSSSRRYFIVPFAFALLSYQHVANHLALHLLLLNIDIVGIVQEIIGSFILNLYLRVFLSLPPWMLLFI